MFDEITKKLLAKLVLIKPTEFLLCGNDLKWNDLSKDDQKTLQALIIDTMDVIEFKDFNQGYYIQVGLRMISVLAGLIFAIQKGSVKHNSICLCQQHSPSNYGTQS